MPRCSSNVWRGDLRPLWINVCLIGAESFIIADVVMPSAGCDSLKFLLESYAGGRPVAPVSIDSPHAWPAIGDANSRWHRKRVHGAQETVCGPKHHNQQGGGDRNSWESATRNRTEHARVGSGG